MSSCRYAVGLVITAFDYIKCYFIFNYFFGEKTTDMGVSDVVRSKRAQGAIGTWNQSHCDKWYSTQLFTAVTSNQVGGKTIGSFGCLGN